MKSQTKLLLLSFLVLISLNNVYAQDKEYDLWNMSFGYGRNTNRTPFEWNFLKANALHSNISRRISKRWNVGMDMYIFSEHSGDVYESNVSSILVEQYSTNVQLDLEEDFSSGHVSYFSIGFYPEFKFISKPKHNLIVSVGPFIAKYKFLAIWHQNLSENGNVEYLTGFVSKNNTGFGIGLSLEYNYIFKNGFFIGPELSLHYGGGSDGQSFSIINIGHSF